ncbi:helicase-like protein [Tanacetum coccineum]|uniref:ATP-dependent DNA helicase n=1 Tax=Tanacetum coccineum TaxID=301880 RepID=A0ABQ5BSG8_9ASTR
MDGATIVVNQTIQKKKQYDKSRYQRRKANNISNENADMEAHTMEGMTHNPSALTRETNIGTDVREEPSIQKTKEYNKSYYQCRKEQNNSQDDLYDFVYNGLPKEHSLLIDQLVPRDGEPRYLQLYFYDAESEFEHRLKWPNLDREIVTILSRVLAPNPYVQTFRSLGNLGPLDKYRVELTASVKVDQRLYNRPTTSEVAGIWVEGNENITTYKRSIVVYGRSEYPTHIQPYFASYDPLSYPMFFPNGEAGWHSRIPREGVDIRELVDDDDDVAEDEEIQDAGKPDIFLTMTCNPNWPEIVENLYEGQTAQDRPDLVTRVFRAKLEYLKQQLFTNHILGVVSSHIYVIKFQKWGLPHAHFLLIMTSADKLANPDHYDKVVCAEIPDPNKHPELHQLVLKHMIHGPCGQLNTQCPCMEGEPKKCRWNYPRLFQETTQQGDDSYPLYRRRDNDIEINLRNSVLDNRWVVPYNPKLLMMFNCHINVEVCSSIKSVKYVFKYVYKSHDKQVANVDKDGEQVINEIKRFQDARYVSPPESMWLIYGFPLSNIHPSVMSLQVHLPNNQFVTFKEDAARQYLYKDIPKHYTWNKSTRKWNRQKQGKMRGIMVSANPANGERFYLRVLLQHVKGPTGFDYLYTGHDDLYTNVSSLSDFDLPKITADVRSYAFGCREVHEECSIVVQEEDMLARHSLNSDQKNAYDTIMRHVDADSPVVFFINGPGGTGKALLYKALLANVRYVS